MPIEVCACGKALRLKDELAGKRVRCPACKGALEVPAGVEELEEVLPAEEPRVRSRRDDDGPRRRRDEDDEDDRPRRRDEDDEDDRPRRWRARLDDSADESPRRKKKRRQASGGGIAVGGVLAGLGLIVLGIGLFVGLLMAGWIWPYSLVIAVLGVIQVVRSLMGGSDD